MYFYVLPLFVALLVLLCCSFLRRCFVLCFFFLSSSRCSPRVYFVCVCVCVCKCKWVCLAGLFACLFVCFSGGEMGVGYAIVQIILKEMWDQRVRRVACSRQTHHAWRSCEGERPNVYSLYTRYIYTVIYLVQHRYTAVAHDKSHIEPEDSRALSYRASPNEIPL